MHYVSFVSCFLVGFFVGEVTYKGLYANNDSAEPVIALNSSANHLTAVKRSMLVGFSEKTEEVCQTAVYSNRIPLVGHLVNGSSVEILQKHGHRFAKTFVHCAADNRPPCHGVKDDMYISECVTVYESAQAMVRLTGSYGPFRMGTLKVPILCECRLRRQYRDFERPDEDANDDQ